MEQTESFSALLEESLQGQVNIEGTVITGTIIAIENDMVLIDAGLKSEGRVPIKEFASGEQVPDLSVGDHVDVFVERLEDRNGEAMLSREKARREESWIQLEEQFGRNERVTGIIIGRVKGGFSVDLNGAQAFLPGSQVDIRPVRDVAPLINKEQPFQILKMDRSRGNIVVSRRAVLEESRAEKRAELIQDLQEGKILKGIVKNITDYGAFVDLGGVDGLLHVTDISWKRVNHPSEALEVGQQIDVQVIRFNAETQRISLGVKQLQADPWEGISAKYPISTKFMGRVTNITDYGAFVELESGVEGLVHISEMSWTKKNTHPGKIISTSQEVEVMILDVDPVKRRISLGLKQCQPNPWDDFSANFPVGSIVEGEIRNITEFGIFIALTEDIDGMVHMTDIDWQKDADAALAGYHKGEMVKARILDISLEKERVSLGIKQLTENPVDTAGYSKGQIVTCTITALTDSGLEVQVGDQVAGFIRKADLSRDRSEQRPDRFAAGEKVDAKITAVEKGTGKLTLSIKAREQAEEKEAMANYGSSDSGASLGDILGAALRQREQEAEPAQAEPAEPAAKKASKKKDAKKEAAEEVVPEDAAPEEASSEEADTPEETDSTDKKSGEEA